jgi:hypothetical protein
MTGFGIAAGILGIALSVGCGATEPSPVPESAPTTTNPGWTPDAAPVTAGIVEELRASGLDAVVAERLNGAPFTVGMYRVALPPITGNNIYVYVYRTAELAADEASRIDAHGNLRPTEGEFQRVIVDYIGRQSFYYRDRVIARHGGCSATITMAMETLFGSPVVVTSAGCM